MKTTKEKILDRLLSVDNHRAFLTLLPFVEKILADMGVYKYPKEYTHDEIVDLVEQAKQFCDTEIEVRLKKQMVQISYHVYAGCNGDWHETDEYSPFGLEQFIAWQHKLAVNNK